MFHLTIKAEGHLTPNTFIMICIGLKCVRYFSVILCSRTCVVITNIKQKTGVYNSWSPETITK